MVDKAILAAKLAAIRDAVGRVREVLPASPAAFETDRTAREVVTLMLNADRVFAIASHELDDLLTFCEQIPRAADASDVR